MANITKRVGKSGNVSYSIRVFVDQKSDGTQTVKSMTWKPAAKMTEKQIQAELNRQATLFEEAVKTGFISFGGNSKFEDYAARWMETAQLAPSSRTRNEQLLERINKAIGHIRLEKLQAHHLEMFYQNLREEGASERGRYAIDNGLDALMRERKLSQGNVAAMCKNVSATTICYARNGRQISVEKAKLIAAGLSVPVESIFTLHMDTPPLDENTVMRHHQLIRSILSKAKKERIIPFNVAAEHATPPKPPRREAKYLTDDQARRVIELLIQEEDIRLKAAMFILLYSGVRLGELLGLSWPDIDMTTGVIQVKRASQYQRNKGITEVSTKNPSSVRAIKVPPIVLEVISQYRIWWLEQRIKNGSEWQGQQERLFIQANGKPLGICTVGFWIKRFREKHDLPEFTPHTCRHTFATLQLAAGVDIRTLQARTGHATATTLLNIYSHALKSATEAAADALDDKLTPQAYKNA